MFTTILIILLALTGALGVFFTLKFGKKIVAKRAEYAAMEPDRYGGRKSYDEADDKFSRMIWSITAIVGIVGAAIVLFFGTFYTQDPGESKVLVSFDGRVLGEDTTEGAGFKAPWVELKDFDIRNQQVIYAASTDNDKVAPDGPQITVQDKEGVSANVDISVRYSIKADAVNEIYTEYLNQENFNSRFIEQTVRSVVRELPGQYTTLELLSTKRAELGSQVQEKLEAKFEKEGVLVDAINIQEIRYPDDVKQRFSDAQNARTEVEKAKAELDAAEISAQKAVVTATAEAEANRLLAASLTPEILQSRYLEALKEGTVYVVPDGSTPYIGAK